MSPVVVDTNVPIAANRQAHAGPECVIACSDALARVVTGGMVVIDDQWRILGEYGAHLARSGQPGPGDAFYYWVLVNSRNPERCHWQTITPLADDPDDFEEFPRDSELASFDRADRKFVAVARAHPEHPPILEATDRGFWEARHALERHGVTVGFLCLDEVRQCAQIRP